MKKLFLISSILLALGITARAQTDPCASGYCPTQITVHHKVGSVSPVAGDITYEVIKSTATGATLCWLGRNLGATSKATSYTDATYTANGWYWQFGSKQGYSMTSGGVITPSSGWITTITPYIATWSNDPCTLLLGTNWRLPTGAEWSAAMSSTLTSPANAYTALYLHANASLYQTGSTVSWECPPASTSDTYAGARLSSTGTAAGAAKMYTQTANNASSPAVLTVNTQIMAAARCVRTYSY